MSYFLSIEAVQKPFEISVDVNKRVRMSCNFHAQARSPVPYFPWNIQSILATAGVSTLNVDTFIGMLANIPATLSPYIHILGTSGIGPRFSQNNDALYEYPSAQIIVGASDLPTAMTLADSCYLAVHGTYNQTIVDPVF